MDYKDAWLIGVEAWKEGDLEKAGQAFEYACRGDKVACPDYVLESSNAALIVQRGLTFLKFHASAEARDCFEHVVNDAPDNVQALTQLGISHLRLREGEQAKTHLSRAVQLDPENATATQWLANALVMLGEYQEALVAADACLKLTPTSVFAKVMRGQAYEKLERWPEALSDYRAILQAAPGNGQFRDLLERTLSSAVEYCEQPTELLDYCRQLRELDPQSKGLLCLREARAHRLLGEFAKAEASLAEARKLSAQGVDLERAELLFCQGREGEALNALTPGDQERFVKAKILNWDREKVVGWSDSRESLGQLLAGRVRIRNLEECLVEATVELGGGRKRAGLLSVKASGLEVKAVLEQRYKEPPVPLGDLSKVDWTEGQLRQELPAGTVPSCHGDSGLPAALGLEESWAEAYKVLVTLASVRSGISRDVVPEFQQDLARRLLRSDRWEPEELREAREALCASWLNKAGPEFLFESLDALSGPVGELTCQAARVALARLGPTEYELAQRLAEKLLRGRVSQRLRCALAYCFPTRPDWTAEALEAWMRSPELNHDGWKLLANVADHGLIQGLAAVKEPGNVACQHFSSLLRLGPAAAQALFVLYDFMDSPQEREAIARSLAYLDSPPVREFFSKKTNDATIGELAREYCQALRLEPSVGQVDSLEGNVLKGSIREDGVLELADPSQRVLTLEGLSRFADLRILSLSNCAPVSLAPLEALENLETLRLADPDGDPAWALVDLASLLKLGQLRSVELPGPAQGHPVYQRLLKVTSKRGAPQVGDSLNLFLYSADRLQDVVAELSEEIKKSFGRNLMQCGLDDNAIEGVSVSWVAAAIYLSAPKDYTDALNLFSEGMSDELLDLAEWLDEYPDEDDWATAIDWTGISYGGSYVEFASNNLYQVERAFHSKLKGEESPLKPSDWDRKNAGFEVHLKELGTFESEPHLDLDRCALTWTQDGQPAARCQIELLGVYSNQEFIAGWADEIASMASLGEPILGLPALTQLSQGQARELAQQIADRRENLAAVREFGRPEGVIYLGLRDPSGCSAAPEWDNNNQPNVADQELFGLLGVVLDTLRPSSSEEMVKKGLDILRNTIDELRRRARLYWYGTRAEKFYLDLVAKLQVTAQRPREELYLALRDNLDEWRIQMEKWKPDPIRYR